MGQEWREPARWVAAAAGWGHRALDALERADWGTLRYINAVIRFEREHGRRYDAADVVDRAALARVGAVPVTSDQQALAEEYLDAFRGYAQAVRHAEGVLERGGVSLRGS